jgi:uncharacterized protein
VQGFGRLCDAGPWAVRLMVLLLALASSGAFAQENANQLTIVVFGDSQAAGLARGLQRVLIEDQRYRILNRTHAGAALVHEESEWLVPIQNFVAREKADIAIAMFGANDRLEIRDAHGASLHFHTDPWREAYAERTDRILAAMHDSGLRVIWCGNPIARSGTYSADMGYINDIFAAETARFGAQFVPLWSTFADDQGRYAAFGKDRDGVTQRMRADDGIHFTAPGYELIAEKLIELFPPPPTHLP